ncbi:MAG: response regulator [bacterium]
MSKILIVEDDTFISKMYEAKLIGLGYQAKVAENGEEALQKIKEWQPDLILLDLILPILDGFEVLKKTKADDNFNKIPIIILSNLDQKENIERGIKLGADDYVMKARFTPSEVVEKIKKCLASKN